VDSGSCASWSSPSKTSAYIRATRAGVSRRPSRPGSSPIPARSSRTAASTRGRSTAISALRLVVVAVAVALAGTGLAGAAGGTAVRGAGDAGAVAARMGQLRGAGLQRLARVVLLGAGAGGGRADRRRLEGGALLAGDPHLARRQLGDVREDRGEDRKSTRLNSSHVKISYAVFCLKKK